jgi:MSHA pilin protein MshD
MNRTVQRLPKSSETSEVLARPHRSGLSLVEVSFATLLVSVMLVGAMQTVGSVLRQRARTAVEHRALLIGKQLLEEILTQAYVEPTQSPVFGLETLEINRSLYDDVDDYHNLDESPPADRSGTVLTGLNGWRRRVTVQYVDPLSPNSIVSDDQGAKRITVDVLENGQLRATVQSLKTDGWPK